MKNPEEFWDEAAEKYAKSPIDDIENYKLSLERTRTYLNPTDKVLELGCGTGSTAILLAESVEHITASDLSRNMIKIGEHKALEQDITNIDFMAADLSAIETGPYNAVLALNLLHLLEDLPTALSRINALLMPDGIFISKTITQFGAGVPVKYRLLKMILPLMQMLGKAPFVNFMNAAELDNAIISAGFEIVETGAYPTRYIVARKL